MDKRTILKRSTGSLSDSNAARTSFTVSFDNKPIALHVCCKSLYISLQVEIIAQLFFAGKPVSKA